MKIAQIAPPKLPASPLSNAYFESLGLPQICAGGTERIASYLTEGHCQGRPFSASNLAGRVRDL